jgi:hypothetical protein
VLTRFRLFLLVAFLFGSCSMAMASEFVWAHDQPFDGRYDANVAVAADGLGMPSLAGVVTAGERCRVTHYDIDGTSLWSLDLLGDVHLQGALYDRSDRLVVYGSFVGSMHAASRQLAGPPGQPRAFVLRLTPAGAVDWLVAPGDPDISGQGVQAMTVDPEGFLWYTHSWAEGSSLIRRLDDSGHVAETIVQENVLFASSVAIGPDGSIWVCGPTTSGPVSFGGHEAISPYFYTKYVVKYSPTRAFEWVQFVEDVTFPITFRIAVDETGNGYFSGPLNCSCPFGDIVPDSFNWVFDLFLTRISASGEFLWLREVPNFNLAADATVGVGVSLSCDASGAAVCGFSRNQIQWVQGEYVPAYGSQDAMVVRFDPEGTYQWGKAAGGISVDGADALALGPDGATYVAGMCMETAHFDGVTLPGAGSRIFIAAARSSPSSVPSPPLPALITGARSSPNPFAPLTRIVFNSGTPGPVRLAVYDAGGVLVRSLARMNDGPGTHAVTWDGRDDRGAEVAAGVYYCRIAAEGEATTVRMVRVR